MDSTRWRWLGSVAAAMLAVPAAASAVIILVSPPVAAWLPGWAIEALRPAAAVVFRAVADLAPDSLAGQVFYGTFAPLPALLGSAALAGHAALLGLPWVVAAALAARWAAGARKAQASAPS